MHAVLSFLHDQPLILLFGLFAVGSCLGAVTVRDVQIGPAAVLFTAIGVSAAAAGEGLPLALPEVVGNLGLVLFAYTVGIISGPGFFAALRGGWRPVATLTGAFVVVAIVVVVLGRMLGLPGPTIAGTFAGALTNTPALAAASERSGDAAATTVGYSISYVYGVAGMLVAAAAVLRRRRPGDQDGPVLTNLTIRVERTDRPTVADVTARHGSNVVFSRVEHGDAGPIQVAEADETLARGDLVTVVGDQAVVQAVAADLGHVSSHTLNTNGIGLDSRRITLSNRTLAGRSLAALELAERFGGVVSRVRRGDVDMVASPEIVVQLGDRLRVIVPADRMRPVAEYLGDSERGMSDINPIGLALGLALGVLLGTVHLPLPGGGFALGAAGGTLLVGLVFGRLGRVGPLITGLPRTAASSLSTFGMLAFLAYAGTKAGGAFTTALTSGLGWRIALTGFVATSLAALAVVVLGRRVHRVDDARLAGMIAGAQTQPAILAFANERTGFDHRVALGYALVYPAAMIAKILLAQLLAGG
ncbi:MAG TPA: TrkA C-terminal domain-containing protein [Kineosporiaceae bacterium]|nr:TrkA C-terminal domain-containing protein [Kineosporiaceae bacterium]